MNEQQINANGSSKPHKRNVVSYSILQAEILKRQINQPIGFLHLGWDAKCSIGVHVMMPLTLNLTHRFDSLKSQLLKFWQLRFSLNIK